MGLWDIKNICLEIISYILEAEIVVVWIKQFFPHISVTCYGRALHLETARRSIYSELLSEAGPCCLVFNPMKPQKLWLVYESSKTFYNDGHPGYNNGL